MDAHKKMQLIGDHAEEKSKGAFAASLYMIGLNFIIIFLLIRFDGARDFFNMILTPVFALVGGKMATYGLLVLADIAAILIFQAIGKNEADKAHFFKN